jgi:SAM-dependent methyltransferase
MTVKIEPVLECRSCHAPNPRIFLDLGETPIANALLPMDADRDQTASYRLAVAFCDSCSLVQLAFELPAEAIFDEHYPYYSSFSDALCAHAKSHADSLRLSRELDADSLVVELASNDGYLLRNFVHVGIPVLGIDPSPGPAKAADAIGVPTIVDFFGRELAMDLRAKGYSADVIIANNVMAHVPDLNSFVEGMSILLAEDGLITIENPYVRELIDHVEFDTIYHEHFCYFSCSAVDALMRRHGLFLNDVEFFPNLHGGTLRWHVGKHSEPTDRALKYLADERATGMTEFGYYEKFAETVKASGDSLKAMLTYLRDAGSSVAAYGAAAKGATLLNSIGIGSELVKYIVDKNTYKQNMRMPGAHLPIFDTGKLTTDRPDYLLLLAWNFKDEIIAQQREYQKAGGRFITPLPIAEIL